MTQEHSDETLCRRVADRDEAAFDVLVERYQGRAYRLAWSLLRNAEDARDVSQEAFLRVYRTAGRFREEARFSTWFHRILVNLCLDHRRRGSWWRRLLVLDDGAGDPERAVLERQPASLADPGETMGHTQLMSGSGPRWTACRRSSERRSCCTCRRSQKLPPGERRRVLRGSGEPAPR